MTTLLEANLNRWDERVRAEAAGQARAEEGARLLCRQATAKFDAHTAERLSGLLEGLTAREDVDRVSDWIIECATGEELPSRVTALRTPANPGPDGHGAPRA